MTIVQQIDGAWTPIHGVQTLERTVATCTVTYHDGRQDEVPCDPYPVAETIDLGKVEQLLVAGQWGPEDLSPYGLRVSLAGSTPNGKQRVGAPSYVERKGVIIEEWEFEDIPARPEAPSPAERLAAVGLSVSDLKALLAGVDA